jgi:CubicO group peptidase (beta-lactamase class C family)
MKNYFIKKASFFLLIVLPFIAGIKSEAQTLSSKTEISDKANLYLTTLTNLNRFSGTVLIARDGNIIINRGYGFANLEHKVLNDTNTIYSLKSVTKQFTAMAILMLQEEKKLNVKDSICKYLTDCPAIWKGITIHQLLSHSSGIPEYADFPGYYIKRKTFTALSDLIKTFKDKNLEFKPGEKFQYSNSNYVLLEQILETVAQKSYGLYLADHIFTSLKMNNTGFYQRQRLAKGIAEGYTWQSDTLKVADYVSLFEDDAAGGLFSTTDDLLKWDQALYKADLISKKSLEKMFTPYKGDYGYGWFIENKFNRKWINHTGGGKGAQTQISRFPEEKITIIVLSNFDRTNIENVTEDLAAIVFEEPYELPKPYTGVTVNPEILNDYAGEYELSSNLVFKVFIEDGNLIGQLTWRKDKMVPLSETSFYMKNFDVEIRFFRNTEGKVDYLTWDRGKKVKKIK